ncbi:MAG: alginate export family protein [Planctomycetota bacterium]
MRVSFWGVVLVLASCPAVGFAQPEESNFGDIVPEKAIRITISGELKLSLASRNSRVFKAILGAARSGQTPVPLAGTASAPRLGPGLTAAQSATPLGGTGSETILKPTIALNLDVQLADGVNTVLTLQTPYQFGDEGGTNTSSTPGVVRRNLEVEQLYVNWKGAFVPELTLRFGIQEFKQDFTGSGNPFFVDVSRAETPFDNPGPNNAAAGTADVGAPQSASAGLVNSQEAAGLHALYELGDLDLELFYFTIGETYRKNSDRTLFGLSLSTASDLTEEMAWSAGVGLYMLQNDSSSVIYTVGGGGAIHLMNESLKLYGEGYVQGGDYREIGGPANGISQRNAFALYGGFRYTLPDVTGSPFFDVSYWEISGDDNGGDSRNTAFVSLENNNDTIIVEDGLYGLDIDQNYRAIKAKAGFSPHSQLRVDALYAFFQLHENNGTYSAAGTTQDKIGDEFDVSLRYFATDYLTFRAAAGWLVDPKALGLSSELSIFLLEARVEF